MAEQSEEEVIETESESEGETDSQNEDATDDNTSDGSKKNSSNWKKMTEAKKQAEHRALQAEKKAEESLLELQKLKEWANSLYEDENAKPFSKKEEPVVDDKSDKLETKIFLLENKEAKDYIDEINTARLKYNMDFDEAWTLVKAKLPQESKTKKDFDTTTKSAKFPKDLTKVTPEEALEFDKDQRTAWRKANGWEF